MDSRSPELERLGAVAADLQRRGVRRIHVLAWRDLDDPDAGGSEDHADECLRRWAGAGLQIVHRTSAAAGHAAEADRHGYHVVRRGSRYTVFPRAVLSELAHRMGPRDALVEIWNGVPWFSPVWFRGPKVVMFHHVHGPMWDQLFGPRLAGLGRSLEARWAPWWYRHSEVVTPSEATREQLVNELGFRPEQVTAVPNGVDPFWSPGDEKAPVPTVVACGRMAPVKRFGLLFDAVLRAREQVPDLRLVAIGDGPERPALRAWVSAHQADDWVELPGAVSDDELRHAYRRAWVVASASLAEGWGLTMTEAAACGTPAVATDIGGHRCSVVDGVTGVLAPLERLGDVLAEVLTDHARRQALGEAALRRARTLTWDATALGLLEVLHGVVARRQDQARH